MAELELGVLAEDDNDCKTIRVVVRRIFEARGVKAGAWRLHQRAAHGCGNLKRRAEPWLVELAASGCTAAIVVHDLDRNPANGSLNDEAELVRVLSAIPAPPGLRRLICIPVEEIEAWFFSSPNVLKKLSGNDEKAHPSPHLIMNPKKALIDLSRGANRRPRYSPNDNPKLAEDLDLAECARRCRSFRELQWFVLQHAPG